MYDNFYGQDFQRSEGIRGATETNLDHALRILESISDGLTAVVRAMFS